MKGWAIFCAVVVVVVIAGLFQLLVYLLFSKIPFMCEMCGHTFTDDEDPSERCPVCNSD